MAKRIDDRARYPDLAGRGVFVSGGASGIGAAFVAAFAAQGSRVAFIDIADAPAKVLAERFGSERVRYFRCDVRDIAALKSAFVRTVLRGFPARQKLIKCLHMS